MTDLTVGLKKSEIENKTAPTFNFDELTSKCREVWDRNESTDLEARHALGKLFIERLNTPVKRQMYGAEAMKKVAADLRMSRSELSRMRQFADQFPTLAEFRKSKPDCKNWTQVKRALVTPTNKRSTKRANGSKTPSGVLIARIRKLTKVLLGDDVLRDGATNSPFLKELQSLVEAVGRYPQIKPQLK